MTDQKLIEHWIQGCAVQRVMFRDGLVLNLEDYNELVISAPIRLTLPATATSPVEVVSVDPNDPAAQLSEAMQAALFVNHPYGHPVIGWEQEMRKLNREEALAFYRRFYAPNNASISRTWPNSW